MLWLQRRSSGRWSFLVEIPVILLWAWWVSLALSRSHLTCIIPCADSCTIICTVHQQHRYKFGNVLPVMAGDCGDEIPSKSKLQSAGITSSANPANLLVIRWTIIKPSIFLLGFRKLRESSKNSLIFSRHHLLKVLPCLSSVTSFFVCKAILSLPPLLFHVAVPLRSLPGTASLISIWQMFRTMVRLFVKRICMAWKVDVTTFLKLIICRQIG